MTQKILIVDGSRAMRKMLELKLNHEDIEVDLAVSANQALGKAHRQLYSLVTTAASLPDEDTQKFVSDLRRVPGYQHTSLLVVTGNDVDPTDFDPRLNIDAIFPKSKGIDALASEILRHMPDSPPTLDETTTMLFTFPQAER